MPRQRKSDQSLRSMDVIRRYEESGNTRPSYASLQSTERQLVGSASDTEQMVLADVYIDLAMRVPEQSRAYLSKSETTLAGFIGRSEARERRGEVHSFIRRLPQVALAHIRLSQLPAWQLAAANEPPVHDYDTLLTGMSEAVSLASIKNAAPQVAGYAREAIPLLLGVRGLIRGTGGWLGRTALHREDRNMHVSSDRQRWDVGICLAGTALSFDRPEVVIDMKAKRPSDVSRRASKYTRAGVMQMRASAYGFADPAKVVWSCVMEQDGTVPEQIEAMPFLESGQLDEMTRRIWDDVQEYHNDR